MPKVIEFCKDTTIVAHNANFDIGFIRENARRLGLNFDYPWIDTLALAKELFPERKKFKLGLIAEDLGIKVDVNYAILKHILETAKDDKELKKMLSDNDYYFKSQTDTEVACALIDYYYQQSKDIKESLAKFIESVKGAYALGIMVKGDNNIYSIRENAIPEGGC